MQRRARFGGSGPKAPDADDARTGHRGRDSRRSYRSGSRGRRSRAARERGFAIATCNRSKSCGAARLAFERRGSANCALEALRRRSPPIRPPSAPHHSRPSGGPAPTRSPMAESFPPRAPSWRGPDSDRPPVRGGRSLLGASCAPDRIGRGLPVGDPSPLPPDRDRAAQASRRGAMRPAGPTPIRRRSPFLPCRYCLSRTSQRLRVRTGDPHRRARRVARVVEKAGYPFPARHRRRSLAMLSTDTGSRGRRAGAVGHRRERG